MPRQSKAKGGLLRASVRSLIGKLLRDTAGNTLGIALATIILLVSLAGSGTDMSRAYMTKTSLQNACDAGVLAGRKAMATSGTYGTSETAKANKMFNFNFNPNATNASSITFTTASSGTGAVTGTATTTMPTVMMGIFGFKSIPMTVECSAELQMASADVMFVLDTTGSMAYNPANTTCCNQSDSKIVGLRQAIRDFYKTVAAAVVDKTNTRIRFGFVPYSSTVNVKNLVASGDLPTSYFPDTQSFQTRLAYFNTPVYVGTAGSPVVGTDTMSNITSSQCTQYGVNNYPSAGGNPASGGGPAPTATTSTTYSWKSWTLTSGSVGTCVRNKSVTTTTYVTNYQFTNWRFNNTTIDVSAFKGMGNVPIADTISTTATVPSAGYYDMYALGAIVGNTGVTGITTKNAAWDGCIEERATVQNLAMSPVPSGATDLDLDSAPSSDATRWKQYINEFVWWRGTTATRDLTMSQYNSGVSAGNVFNQASYCPASAMGFTDVDTNAPTTVPSWLETYVNTLVASGPTYHDIGMIWGARIASPTGIFASKVTADSTKYPSISRHIIFMTDGDMAPNNSIYTSYGQEYNDNRVAPSGTSSGTLTNYHNNRYLAACTRAKNLGYTIWVIGFGQALTTQMTSCATAGRAYFAGNTTTLNNTFKFIAGQVADLRINK